MKSSFLRAIARWPTRISVCTAPGLSMMTTRRVGGGGSIGFTTSTAACTHLPNARSAPANASSGDTSPTMARMALLAPNHFLWNATRSLRVSAVSVSGVPDCGRP